ncbi:serine/threonine protein kinase [Marinihelvus fidelis]|uniref:Serine/threonine protein kinase n=1 Tax=Marinihelvus fidelis TaxID=2613842 RepID=A0A5N0TIW0_9GAMM|nr:serine/threonine-protein kinase [Marinihelvus fidelis]KAA9134037.1 serine/threonine protein kinase [Marinihelvus fidelis]
MGDPRDFETLDAWFDRLLDAAPDERERTLADLRRDDPELADSLVALLTDVTASEGFLENEASAARDRMLAEMLTDDGWRPSGASPKDRCGETLGPYRLESVLGRGQKSVVYLARRADGEWDEQVAVKVLSRGVDTDDVLRRFLAERQIMTVLRHPHIGVMLDGGVTDDGLPYFAMEYIDGQPIDDWCREQALPLAGRLALVRSVCEAVAFAHRRLVVHRDIKPSNILVNRDRQVKLLDFGIAKWLDPQAQPGFSARTQHMVRPMTPAYAAPEQREGGPVSTATDVYQLGLLMVTLLCGVDRPRHAMGVDDRGAPQRRASTVATAANLPYPPAELRGDLDGIIHKALSADPEQRYGSAAELLADLDNYREHRAVQARTPGAAYMFGKFVRRRPLVTSAIAFALVALSVWALLVAHYNRQLQAEKAAALDALERAEETRNVLVRFMTEADPFNNEGSGADARIRDALAGADEIIGHELAGRPALQADLYGVVADVWDGLSEGEAAGQARRGELAALASLPDADPVRVLMSRHKLLNADASDLDTATFLAEIEKIRDTLARDWPDAVVERATVEKDLGYLHRRYGSPDVALAHTRAAVELLDTEPSPDPIQLSFALIDLGEQLAVDRQFDQAMTMMERALAIRLERLGETHAWTLTNRLQIASLLTDMGRLEEAIELYDALVPGYEQRLGPLHGQTVSVMNNHAMSLMGMGRYEEAEDVLSDVVARRRRAGGESSRSLADGLQNLGAIQLRLGMIDQAVVNLNTAAEIYQQVLLPGNPLLGYPHLTLASIHADRGDVDALIFHAGQAELLLQGNVPEHHPAWQKVHCLVGDAQLRQGQLEAGEARVRQGLAGFEAIPGMEARHLDECRAALARAGIAE